MSDVSVIIPSYCEAENLPILVPRIHEALTAAGLHYEIVVVDDNSPDGTADVSRRLGEQFPLRLVVRERERGLSSAVIAGMQIATGHVLVVMDADLSHPPEKIPELVATLEDPAVDFVIGSRYVAGGETTEDWGLFRRLNSRAATLLARPLTRAGDPMAGFFALRKTTYDSIEKTLDPIGYKIGLELIVKSGSRNVAEIPILFRDRLHGQSKLSFKEQLNYLRHLRRLYNHRYGSRSRFLQFAAVGLSGMAVDLCAFWLLLGWLSVPIARALAILVAMTWNFNLNRNVTFSYARTGSLLRQYLAYCGSCAVGAALNWSASVALCAYVAFFSRNQLAAALVGVLVGMASNFLLCQYFVFRDRSSEPADRETESQSDRDNSHRNRSPAETDTTAAARG